MRGPSMQQLRSRHSCGSTQPSNWQLESSNSWHVALMRAAAGRLPPRCCAHRRRQSRGQCSSWGGTAAPNPPTRTGPAAPADHVYDAAGRLACGCANTGVGGGTAAAVAVASCAVSPADAVPATSPPRCIRAAPWRRCVRQDFKRPSLVDWSVGSSGRVFIDGLCSLLDAAGTARHWGLPRSSCCASGVLEAPAGPNWTKAVLARHS